MILNLNLNFEKKKGKYYMVELDDGLDDVSDDDFAERAKKRRV